MKHLQIFENFNDWKIGDVVVAIIGNSRQAPLDFYSSRGKLIFNDKYKIIDIVDDTIRVEDKEGNYVRNKFVDKTYRKVYLLKNDFISLEDWILKQTSNKYNL